MTVVRPMMNGDAPEMVKQQFTVEISPLVDYICGDEAAILSLYQ